MIVLRQLYRVHTKRWKLKENAPQDYHPSQVKRGKKVSKRTIKQPHYFLTYLFPYFLKILP